MHIILSERDIFNDDYFSYSITAKVALSICSIYLSYADSDAKTILSEELIQWQSFVNQLLTKNIDLRGRRVINADDARSEGEYVTLRQHRSLIAKIVAPILDSISNIYKFRDSGGKSYSNIIV